MIKVWGGKEDATRNHKKGCDQRIPQFEKKTQNKRFLQRKRLSEAESTSLGTIIIVTYNTII